MKNDEALLGGYALRGFMAVCQARLPVALTRRRRREKPDMGAGPSPCARHFTMQAEAAGLSAVCFIDHNLKFLQFQIKGLYFSL
ncbi:hypothetical protein ACDT17_04540 [Chromobacterium piscinae]|uniref:hypothetical protein n=1 Tax=Chromobacterium piscinae TaxID=686831 RepID=UPI003555DB8F